MAGQTDIGSKNSAVAYISNTNWPLLQLKAKDGGLMEKFYQDYNWHLWRAVYWHRMIGKDKRAEQRHKAHLDWANGVLADFKAKNHGLANRDGTGRQLRR